MLHVCVIICFYNRGQVKAIRVSLTFKVALVYHK